ncbi:uncharacterized protein LOC126264150 [Aethina tumida]|uniref:uncharacterized protein LOC126264150 n=1 Tax=Aethina tumida TaxID=116153 RepID=UPI0021474A71|nr:uncharacterized protein LOC126264150 [Aethina tumida]
MPLPPETQCSGLNIEEDSETNYENTNHTKNEARLYQNMKKNEDNAIRKKPIPLPRISYSLDEINIETYNKVMMNGDVEEESIEMNEEEIYNIFPNSTKNTLEKELSTPVAAKRKIDFKKPGQEVELRGTGSLRTKTLKNEQRNLSKSIENIEMLNKAKLVNYIRRLSVKDLIESYESLDGIEQERVREEFQEAKLERLKEECLKALSSIFHIQMNVKTINMVWNVFRALRDVYKFVTCQSNEENRRNTTITNYYEPDPIKNIQKLDTQPTRHNNIITNQNKHTSVNLQKETKINDTEPNCNEFDYKNKILSTNQNQFNKNCSEVEQEAHKIKGPIYEEINCNSQSVHNHDSSNEINSLGLGTVHKQPSLGEKVIHPLPKHKNLKEKDVRPDRSHNLSEEKGLSVENRRPATQTPKEEGLCSVPKLHSLEEKGLQPASNPKLTKEKKLRPVPQLSIETCLRLNPKPSNQENLHPVSKNYLPQEKGLPPVPGPKPTKEKSLRLVPTPQSPAESGLRSFLQSKKDDFHSIPKTHISEEKGLRIVPQSPQLSVETGLQPSTKEDLLTLSKTHLLEKNGLGSVSDTTGTKGKGLRPVPQPRTGQGLRSLPKTHLLEENGLGPASGTTETKGKGLRPVPQPSTGEDLRPLSKTHLSEENGLESVSGTTETKEKGLRPGLPPKRQNQKENVCVLFLKHQQWKIYVLFLKLIFQKKTV